MQLWLKNGPRHGPELQHGPRYHQWQWVALSGTSHSDQYDPSDSMTLGHQHDLRCILMVFSGRYHGPWSSAQAPTAVEPWAQTWPLMAARAWTLHGPRWPCSHSHLTFSKAPEPLCFSSLPFLHHILSHCSGLCWITTQFSSINSFL